MSAHYYVHVGFCWPVYICICVYVLIWWNTKDKNMWWKKSRIWWDSNDDNGILCLVRYSNYTHTQTRAQIGAATAPYEWSVRNTRTNIYIYRCISSWFTCTIHSIHIYSCYYLTVPAMKSVSLHTHKCTHTHTMA